MKRRHTLVNNQLASLLERITLLHSTFERPPHSLPKAYKSVSFYVRAICICRTEMNVRISKRYAYQDTVGSDVSESFFVESVTSPSSQSHLTFFRVESES